jgi:hypothetical protein
LLWCRQTISTSVRALGCGSLDEAWTQQLSHKMISDYVLI